MLQQSLPQPRRAARCRREAPSPLVAAAFDGLADPNGEE
jgi:hypothetical protein